MKKLHLGVRSTVGYVAAFALGQLTIGVGVWVMLRHNLYLIIDHSLEYRIEDLKSFLEAQRNDATVAELQQQVAAKYAIEHAGDYLQLHLEAGDLIYRSVFLQSHSSILIPPDQIKRPILRSSRAEGRPLRFIYQKLKANGHVYAVAMGIPADDVVGTMNLFRSFLMIMASLLSLMAAGLGYWISRRALAPVSESTG